MNAPLSQEYLKTATLPRIVVGLSGGIDSTVCALLLKEQGYEVIGVTLRLRPCGDADSQQKSCCGPDAAGMAGSVAAQLGIRHYVVDCREHFEADVLRPCWKDFEGGATPNPCVLCNAAVRFDELLAIGRKLGADLVATGHYARLEFDELNRPLLLRGVDPNKDQTYFLHALAPETLRHVRFPLGGMVKPEVRALAQANGLVNAERSESQDVCFAGPEGHFAEFLRRQYNGRATPGVFVDETGRVLATHTGIHQYTIGQRRGLGFATGERVKVTAIDPVTGTITVSVGIACYPEDGDDVTSLIAASDRALYLAKRNGRNRVEGVEPMTSVTPMAMKMRDDEVTDGSIADAIMANAPAREDHFFLVSKVVE